MGVVPLIPRNNLSDVANAATARSNLAALGGSLGSTDNRILRSDGTGGATAQGSAVTVDDNADVTGIRNLTASGTVQGNLVSANSGFSSGLDYKINGERFLTYSGTSIVLCPTANGWTDLAIQKPVAITGNLTASGRIESTAAGTSNSQGKFGSFELQSYAVNNAWLGENVYYSGSGSDFTYRANGYGVVIRSISGEVQIETCPSGTAGAAATPTIRAKFGQSGAFGIGGAISSGSGTYSGAAIVGDSSKNLTFAANATVVGTIYVGSTANEIWAQYGYLNLRNTGGNGVTIQDGSGVSRVQVSGSTINLNGNVYTGHLKAYGNAGNTYDIGENIYRYRDGYFAGTLYTGNLTASGTIYAANGYVTTPSYSFTNDTNTGWYSYAADIMTAAAGGKIAAQVDLNGSSNYCESGTYLRAYNFAAAGSVFVGASTFAALPSASANTGAILRVTDRGQKLVHSDGTDWRFVHDNTIAS